MPSELKPTYLITGSDRPKVARAVRRLRERIGADAAETLDAAETSGDDAVAACNALGLFGAGTRLVVVDDVERWKAPDAKAVAEYLSSPAPGTVLALVGEGIKADAPLAKACAKAGEVLRYEAPRKRDLPAWVADQFARRSAHADADACRALAELVGDDLDALALEVEKLATWAGGETIGVRDVELLAVPHSEASVFSLTDTWGQRDVAGALRACDSLLERSSREITSIAGLLASHVGKVRACQALAAEGVRPRDAAGRLKMHPFAAEKAFAQAANFSVEELRAVTVRLAALDAALKGRSRISGELELARALLDITRAEREAVPATA
ncbi:MAG: DNA polymerase III subunit delta [Actinobacteria bacterium]|nr:MAG: DNA polymerase III subunit delta [Actinomycetota bacterium]